MSKQLRRLFLLKVKGFTLVEALIAILILSLIVIGVANLITGSIGSTRDRIIMECLVNAANSAIEACRAGIDLNTYRCGNFNINLSKNQICANITPPSSFWDATCREVTVTATYGNYQHRLTDLICRFGDENF
uniref:Prepilin-type N-terminal cleavage/methylation domain-containing protein n=1 Tax=Thermodesulfobacterium geofontis TaxID=1295609 RepID=A0A7C4JSG6_9BACT